MAYVDELDLRSAIRTLEATRRAGSMTPTSEITNAMVTIMLSMLEQQAKEIIDSPPPVPTPTREVVQTIRSVLRHYQKERQRLLEIFGEQLVSSDGMQEIGDALAWLQQLAPTGQEAD